MKKILGFIIVVFVLNSGFIFEEKPFEDRLSVAEKIWMAQGVEKILDNIKTEYNLSDVDFVNFKKVNYKSILNDQFRFFNSALQDESFLLSDTSLNYEEWLKTKETYYKKECSFFIENKDSVVNSFLKMSAVNYMTDDCDTTAGCVNIGFESSNFHFWTRYLGYACADGTHGDAPRHYFNAIDEYDVTKRIQLEYTGYDPLVGSHKLHTVCPGGSVSVRLEDDSIGGRASRIERIMHVPSNAGMYYYKYACVLEDPGDNHPDSLKPFFRVRVLLLDGGCNDTGEIECARYVVIANPNDPEVNKNFSRVGGTNYYYKNWTTVGIPLADYAGKVIKIEFTASDCGYGGHLGYAYVDGECLGISTPTISACDLGKRALEAPIGFTKYEWTGPGITCCNNEKTTYINEPGSYHLKATTVSGCSHNYTVSADSCAQPDTLCTISSLVLTVSGCNDSTNYYDLSGTLSFPYSPKKGVLAISNGSLTELYRLPLTSPFNFKMKKLISDGKNHAVTVKFYKNDFMSSAYLSCMDTVHYNSPNPCHIPPISCVNCLTSFNPEPGRYIISAWVKQLSTNPDVQTYTYPFIQIQFSNGATTLSKMYASGKIIDQWQRIFYEFSIPIGATNISINLGTDNGSALFDDIRIHPANGSFVSYVYDPVSLKLVATLDDNNYATIYEYDDEGTLLRVKKETERGIMTIKESRENSPKR